MHGFDPPTRRATESNTLAISIATVVLLLRSVVVNRNRTS
jgi:hypothetical protein